MKTYYVSEHAIVIGLAEEENLPEPHQLEECLLKCGLPRWGSTESDLFCFQGGRMLIARPAPPKRFRVSAHDPRYRRRV